MDPRMPTLSSISAMTPSPFFFSWVRGLCDAGAGGRQGFSRPSWNRIERPILEQKADAGRGMAVEPSIG